MTNPNESPFFQGVHTEPPREPLQGLSQEQARGLRERLITSIIQVVVQAITGVFTPGGGLAGGLGQLTSWVSTLPLVGDILGWIQEAIEELISNIFEMITGFLPGGNLLTDLTTAFRNIPFLNILGIGGPSNIGDSFQSTWDQIVGGLTGSIGSGASPTDLFSVHQEVSSKATLGSFSWDLLGIRTNKPLFSGFFPTGESNIGLDKVALQPSAPTFGVTQSTAIMSFQRISEFTAKRVVSWLGSGTSGLTGAFVNIYQMDPTTGDLSLKHASGNILGSLSSSMQHNVYEIPGGGFLNVIPSEIYGIEIAVEGGGTHNVVGASTWLPDHPSVYPRRLSAERNSGGTAAPSTISSGSVSYASNVPFIEFAVSAGDVALPQSATSELFDFAQTTTLATPDWANEIQIIQNPGAGGGHQGGTWGVGGAGGDPGSWDTITWTRGVDFAANETPILGIVVGAGGTGGSGNGANGSNTVTTLPATTGFPSQTLTSTGGIGSTTFDVLGSAHAGDGPGDVTYDSIPYIGGPTQNTYGGDGVRPGGAGAGGNWISFQFGGDGADGVIWARFKQ